MVASFPLVGPELCLPERTAVQEGPAFPILLSRELLGSARELTGSFASLCSFLLLCVHNTGLYLGYEGSVETWADSLFWSTW